VAFLRLRGRKGAAMPSTATDRLYGLTTSVAVKPPCRVATTANITLAGLQTISGLVLVAGDRVLAKDQTDTTTNGIYIASTSAWSRAPDFDGTRDVVNGTLVVVCQSDSVGTINIWQAVATDPVVIGTSAITFMKVTNLTLSAVETQTATAGQTLFTLTEIAYTPSTNDLQVFSNGLRLVPEVDYTETSSTSVTLVSGAAEGDEFLFSVALPVNVSMLAAAIGYTPGGSGAVATTVAKWLDRQTPVAFNFMSDAEVSDVRAGTALVDVATPLDLVFSTGLRAYKLQAGVYKFNTGLVSDYSAGGYPTPGQLTSRYYIKGESLANTVLNYAGAGYAITAIGQPTVGSGQGIHSLDALETFTLQDAAQAKSNSGILLQNKAYTHIKEVSLEYLDIALEIQSCFSSGISDFYAKNSTVGIRLTSSGALGAPNAIAFRRVTLTGNSFAGVQGVAVGTCNSFRDVTIESCGTHGDMTTGGMLLSVGSAGYAGPLTLDNIYFESNKGAADLSIDNTTASHLTVILSGCLFNRASNTAYTHNNILVTNSGGGTTTLLIKGNLFLSIGSYVADAARPSFNVDSSTEVIDLGGNYFNDSTDLQAPFASGPSLSGAVSAAGAISGSPGFLSAAKTGTGVYRVTSTIPLGKTVDFYEVMAMCTDTGGATLVHRCTKISSTAFDVVTSSNALTPTDAAFSFVVQKKGG
jgi:hypothetical protein